MEGRREGRREEVISSFSIKPKTFNTKRSFTTMSTVSTYRYRWGSGKVEGKRKERRNEEVMLSFSITSKTFNKTRSFTTISTLQLPTQLGNWKRAAKERGKKEGRKEVIFSFSFTSKKFNNTRSFTTLSTNSNCRRSWGTGKGGRRERKKGEGMEK